MSDAPKLLSISQMSKPPFNAWVKKPDGHSGELQHAFPENPYRLTQSTACPQAFMSNGCISIYAVSELKRSHHFPITIGFEMPQIASIDIDFEYEFDLASLSFPSWSEDLEYFQVSS